MPNSQKRGDNLGSGCGMIAKMKLLLPVLLLFLSAFFGVPSLAMQARATTDLVCIADQLSNPTDCPSSPANLTGLVGSNVTVAVNVQGVDSLNGFDIAVHVNPAILQPVSVSLADSLIQEPRILVLQTVNSTSGIARLATSALGYTVPGTGNLFEIVYEVLSSDNGTAITFGLGCTHQASAEGICVTLTNPGVVYVTLQTASFGGPLAPDFSMTASPSFQTLLGSSDTVIGSGSDSMIVLFGTGGFTGPVDLSTTLPPLCPASNCPSWSLSVTTLTLFSERAALAALTFSVPPGTPAGTWNVNVTATSGSISNSVTATFKIVPPPRFSISTDTSTLTLQRGQSGTITLRLTETSCGNIYQPDKGCVGLWGFSTSISPDLKKGPSIRYGLSETSLPTFTLLSSIVVSTNSTTHPGTYIVMVFASNKWIISTITLTVIVVPTNRANI